MNLADLVPGDRYDVRLRVDPRGCARGLTFRGVAATGHLEWDSPLADRPIHCMPSTVLSVTPAGAE